jgi:hypothetical protein
MVKNFAIQTSYRDLAGKYESLAEDADAEKPQSKSNHAATSTTPLPTADR